MQEFGIKRDNEERRDGGCGAVFDPETGLFAVGRDEEGWLRLFAGGVEVGENAEEGSVREVVEESGLHDFLHVEKLDEVITHYFNYRKKIYRVANATCMLIILKSRDTRPTALEEHEKFVLDWASAEKIIKNWEARNQNKDYDHWIYFMNKAIARIKELGYNPK